MSESKPDRSSLRQARAPEDLADRRFVGGATAAEVVGGADLRASADAEEKKSDCGKAAVSSGELGSSQDPTGQTDCLWKLRVNVGAGGSLKLQRRPPPSPPSSSCVAAETVNNIESWRRTGWKEGELGDVLLDSGSRSAPAFRSPSPHTCSFNQPGSGIHLM